MLYTQFLYVKYQLAVSIKYQLIVPSSGNQKHDFLTDTNGNSKMIESVSILISPFNTQLFCIMQTVTFPLLLPADALQ